MQARLTEQTRRAIRHAQAKARETHSPCVEPEHLLYGVLQEEHSQACVDLRTRGYSPGAIKEEVDTLLPTLSIDRASDSEILEDTIPLSVRAMGVYRQATEIAIHYGRYYVGPEHIVMALVLKPTDALAAIWKQYGVTITLPPQNGIPDVNKKVPANILPTLSKVGNWKRYTDTAKQAIEHASREAIQLGYNQMLPSMLLAGILQEPKTVVSQALYKCGVERNTLREALTDILEPGTGFHSESPLILSRNTLLVMEEANNIAASLGDRHIGTEHLFLGFLARSGEIGDLLRSHGLVTANFVATLRFVKRGKRVESVKSVKGSHTFPRLLTRIGSWLLVMLVIIGFMYFFRGCQ